MECAEPSEVAGEVSAAVRRGYETLRAELSCLRAEAALASDQRRSIGRVQAQREATQREAAAAQAAAAQVAQQPRQPLAQAAAATRAASPGWRRQPTHEQTMVHS